MLSARNNVIMLSGPTPHTGKSFASANFAAVLAPGGKRVLPVDADFRRATGIAPWACRERGPTEVMDGSLLIDHAIRRDVQFNVDFLGVGNYPEAASEVRPRGDFQRVMKEVIDDYDVVVVDAATVLAVSDVGIIAPAAGTVLLLRALRRHPCDRSHDCGSAAQQGGCDVTVLLLNAVPEGAGGYVHARRYGGEHPRRTSEERVPYEKRWPRTPIPSDISSDNRKKNRERRRRPVRPRDGRSLR